MKPSKIIIIILVIVLFTASCSSEKEEPQANAEMNLQLLGITSQLNSIKGNISSLQNQLEDIEDSIDEKANDESTEIEATNRLLNKVLDELEELRDIGSYNHERISFLEKEIIKQTSGAYDDYNNYYYDCNNYSYSVRFSKDYSYEATEPTDGKASYGVGASLKIYLDDLKDSYILIWPWHSYGLSTTAKSETVKPLITDEGTTAEYVIYDVDDKGYLDFGFEEYTLKVSVVYDNENSAGVVEKVFDIVRTIMFYDSLYVK